MAQLLMRDGSAKKINVFDQEIGSDYRIAAGNLFNHSRVIANTTQQDGSLSFDGWAGCFTTFTCLLSKMVQKFNLSPRDGIAERRFWKFLFHLLLRLTSFHPGYPLTTCKDFKEGRIGCGADLPKFQAIAHTIDWSAVPK